MGEGNFLVDIYNLISTILQKSNLFHLGVTTATLTSIVSIIISIFAYLIKRKFALIDYENQQDIQHSKWLLKKLHKYAEKHYRVLTRNFYNAELSLAPAAQTKDKTLINNAYQQMSQLIKKYMDFKDETGGVILLLNREKQNEAISKIQSLLLSLPFDSKDFSDIQHDLHDRARESFERWLGKSNCPKSISLVKLRLFELRSLFDTQTEKILQHESFLKSRKRGTVKIRNIWKKIKNKVCKPNQFYIHKIEPKYAKSGETITVIGNGFSNDAEKTYALKFNGKDISDSPISETMTKIEVPQCTPDTYEITAIFPKNPKKKELMGIVIHITQ